jgi:hypothetical protein
VASNLSQILRAYLDTVNRALNGIAAGRLAVSQRSTDVETTRLCFVGLDQGRSVSLRGPLEISLAVRQALQIVPTNNPLGLHNVEMVAYQYHVEMAVGRELISFHWNRRAVPPEPSSPHIHLGSVVSAGSAVLPDRFDKLHIPGGPVSLAAVVRFAITELDVEPLPGRGRAGLLRELEDLDLHLRGW